MTWIGTLILGAVITLEAFRWHRTVRLFGRVPWWVPQKMIRIAGTGRNAWFLRASVVLVVTYGVLAVPLSGAGLAMPLGAILVGLAATTVIVSRCAQPPLALLLTSSGPRAAELLTRVNAAIFPLRAVALLNKHWLLGWYAPWQLDNLRTSDEKVWRSVIHHLIDIAPVVVIDTCGPTVAVAQEASLMMTSERVRKALFLTDDARGFPALKANGIDPAEHALQLKTPSELVEMLAAYARGREYLPWPVDLSQVPKKQPLVGEQWEALPSVLVAAHPEQFDSASLVSLAVASDKELLTVVSTWSHITRDSALYLLDLGWAFVHDPQLASIRVWTFDVLIVRIAFLRDCGADLPRVTAAAGRWPLSFEQLNEPDPVSQAVSRWTAQVERAARDRGWRTREVHPPITNGPASMAW